MGWFKSYKVEDLKTHLSREELIRRSRILIIDDERPDIIDDLKKAGFAIDYETDMTSDNMKIIENSVYDLLLLDYGNVGKSFGTHEGLDLLKHIKRVNPAIIILAYTSKNLSSDQADFYRLTDGVLSKDAGIQTSLEKIEEGLEKAHSIQNIWGSFLQIAGISVGSEEDKEWQNLYIKSFNSKKKLIKLKQKAAEVLKSDNSKKIGFALLEKGIELSIKHIFGL
jgi:DNA-binding NarL/FixJ family response regulator